MKTPISEHWKNLTNKQAWLLIIAGFLLEIPIRWIIRPDMGQLVPGNFWFNLPLRLIMDGGMLAFFFALPFFMKTSFKNIGIPLRRWTKWEWIALLIIGSAELIIVISVSGGRWGRILELGILGPALIWSVSEFMFGMNQETGFRGIMMTGILKIKGWKWATLINTLFFLIGPLHGPGILRMFENYPGAALGYTAGVIVNGLAFSWIRYKTDNVLLVAILHGIINGFLNGAGLVLRAQG